MKTNISGSNKTRYSNILRGEFFWGGTCLYLLPYNKPGGDCGITPPISMAINLTRNRFETIAADELVEKEDKPLEITYA